MKTTSTLAALTLALCCLASSASAQHLRTVALSGTPAPGTSGLIFSELAGNGFATPPVLNNAGQTAFKGKLTGTGVGFRNGRGVWSEGGGNGLALIAREGNAAPGLSSGANFNFFNNSPALPGVLNDAGQIAFRIGFLGPGIEGAGANEGGIWSGGGGNGLTLVALTGTPAPGTSSGVNFFGFSRDVMLNNAGQTAFLGTLFGTGVDGRGATQNNTGIWSEGGGNGLALVARAGNAAPGTNSGVNFFRFFGPPPAFNDAGHTAFVGSLTGAGVDDTNENGIWSEGGGNGLALVARSGNPAPGTSSGVNFSFFSNPALNSAGQTAFAANLAATGVNSTISSGIWSEGGGNGLALVARAGSAAPGTSSGVNFSSSTFRGNPFPVVINDAGRTAFPGRLSGTGVDDSNDRGIWSEGGGNGLALVAREGNAAPGTSSGVNFSALVVAPVLNSAGQIVFLGGLTGTGVDDTNDRGIWAEDPSGVLTLIVREGDLLDVDDGPSTDFRTVSSLRFESSSVLGGTGNGDGRRSGFNDLGQLTFAAIFTDGSSGIFVSNLVAVPEPTTCVLAAAGLFGLCAAPRRRRK